MPRKPRVPREDRLWIAPQFSLTKRPLKVSPAKAPNREFPPLSPELDSDSSVARLLELADIALGGNKDEK